VYFVIIGVKIFSILFSYYVGFAEVHVTWSPRSPVDCRSQWCLVWPLRTSQCW